MVKKLKGEKPTLTKEEDRGTSLVDANENLNQNPEEEDQDVKSVEKMEQENTNSEKNPDQEDGEIGYEERWSHETPVINDVQPNEEEGDEDDGSEETREFNPIHNNSETSLTELEELVDVMGEWTCLERTVAALEEKDMNKIEALKRKVAALEEDVNNVEGLHRSVTALEEDVHNVNGFQRRVAALEAYVDKVGEDTPEDVKTRHENGKGVKRTVHALDDNLSRTMSGFKRQK